MRGKKDTLPSSSILEIKKKEIEMTSNFSERYHRGEYKQVWQEILQLGESIREEAVYSDVQNVVSETIDRIGSNIETIVPRLVSIGYRFGYCWIQPDPNQPFSYKERKRYTSAIEWAGNEPLIFNSIVDLQRERLLMEERIEQFTGINASTIIIENIRRNVDTLKKQENERKSLVERLEQLRGDLPLSIRTWYQKLGEVNFVGSIPEHWRKLLDEEAASLSNNDERRNKLKSLGFLDPLYISPL